MLGVSAAVVAGVSAMRLGSDGAPAPHDPVTLGLHTGAPLHAVRARPAVRRAVRRPVAPPARKPKATAHPAARTTPVAQTTRKAKAPAASPAPKAIAPVPVRLPTFTWTPVAGATGYEFQLFRGSALVYVARTPTASITVPPTWTREGRLVRVTPGTYRWYVWPLAGETRQERAVVQAKLTVGG